MKKIALYLVVLVGLVALLGVVTTFFGGKDSRPSVHAQIVNCKTGETSCLSGWAWSSNIGWVSFNSNDDGATGGGIYDVALDATGNLNGYAWSSNIGWIKFGGLSGFPSSGSSATNAKVDFVSGHVTGWAKALSADGNGWDGWIELSGINHDTGTPAGTAGITFDPSSGTFKGYAWGGTVVGWLLFSPSTAVGGEVKCEPNCGGGGPSLNLNVIDGNGLPNSIAIFNYDPTVTTSKTVQVKWNSVGVDSIAYSGDWPSTSNGTPTVIAPNVDGSANLTFTGLPMTGSIKKTLYLQSTIGSGFGAQSGPADSVEITFTATAGGGMNACIKPANSVSACGTTETGPAKTVNSCTTTSVDCQFVCDIAHGFKANASGTACIKSTIEEI